MPLLQELYLRTPAPVRLAVSDKLTVKMEMGGSSVEILRREVTQPMHGAYLEEAFSEEEEDVYDDGDEESCLLSCLLSCFP